MPALAELAPDLPANQPPLPLTFELRLPTRTGRPALSPLLRSYSDRERDAKHPFSLERWQVEGILIPTVQALCILSSIPTVRSPLMGSIVAGGTLLFWSAAAKLALQVLVQGQMIPMADEGPDGVPRAGWLPLLSDPQVEAPLSRLVSNMPSLARIMPHFGGNMKGPLQPRSVVEGFLCSAVDESARTWCYNRYSAQQASGEVVRLPDSAWMAAMLMGAGQVKTGTPLELKDLPRNARQWTATLMEGAKGAPYRTCLKLEPPGPPGNGADADTWNLTFNLQSKDDPDILVPAEEVWRARGRSVLAQGKRFDNAQETLLGDLAQAAKLYPPLESSLHDAAPAGSKLSAEGAYQFLAQGAPLLHQAGLGVIIPQEIRQGSFVQPSLVLRVMVRDAEAPEVEPPDPLEPPTGPLMPGDPELLELSEPEEPVPFDPGVGVDALLDFDWEIVLGEHIINREEFDRISSMKVPQVKIKDRFVVIPSSGLRSARRFVDRCLDQVDHLTLGETLALNAGVGEGEELLPIFDFQAQGALSSLYRPGEAEELPVPKGFKGTLRPYQIRGFEWLVAMRARSVGCCLADDMGLGKTIQFLTLLLHDQERLPKEERGPTLLICPTSVASNWDREARRFAPSIKKMVHHGADRRTGKAFAREAAKHDLVISTYSLVARDLAHLKAVKWKGIALDEAQNVKNEAAKQSQAVRELRGDFRVALTGTPIENRLSELWSLMDFLNPGYVSTAAAFRRDFSIPIERFGDTRRANQLRKLVGPFILRRLKSDPTVISDLPDKLEMKVYCSLTKEQAKLYEDIVDKMMAKLKAADGIKRRGLVLASLTKLKQLCNHPAHFLADESDLSGRSGKLSRLEEMMEEVLDTDEKALVFTQYAEMGKLLQQHLAERFGLEVPFFYGAVSAKHRQQMVDDFQMDHGGPRVMILSLKAGGLGLNLTRASHVFHFDRWWNPAVEDQATDRTYRIGQTRTVQVHKLISAGTLEERIDQLIEKKKGLADRIVGSGEAWVTEMNDDELRELVELQKDAIGED